jgi:metal-dependent amidase/aminoacylase/carboxypeptidase family protein
MEGTFRTFDEQWRITAHTKMKKMAEELAQAMGGHCEFVIEPGYPYLANDVPLTERAISYAKQYMGEENVVDLDMRMTAEDFAWYSHHVPACFYRLGTGNVARGITSPVHTSTFDIDEKALETGMGLMAWLAVCELGG